MANIAASTPVIAGAVATGVVVTTLAAAAGGGDSFDNDGRTLIMIKNGGGGSITVTFDSLRQSDQGTDVNPVLTVAAGAHVLVGPFPVERFNDANGRVGVTYSGVTTVTVGAVRI